MEDSVIWGGTPNGTFTIKSAYEALCNNQCEADDVWTHIWRWKGPHQVQTFVWLVTHGRLLMNHRRNKWSVSISPVCYCCGCEEESQIHVLHDCIYATQVWLRIVSSSLITHFFSLDGKDWILHNIKITQV